MRLWRRKAGRPRTAEDIACLAALAGATFGPDAKLILPSGEVLNADEAQVFTALEEREVQR
jgi:hypothetical protein